MDEDVVNEQAFLRDFCELMDCSEAHARAVYMFLAILGEREPEIKAGDAGVRTETRDGWLGAYARIDLAPQG